MQSINSMALYAVVLSWIVHVHAYVQTAHTHTYTQARLLVGGDIPGSN